MQPQMVGREKCRAVADWTPLQVGIKRACLSFLIERGVVGANLIAPIAAFTFETLATLEVVEFALAHIVDCFEDGSGIHLGGHPVIFHP